MMFVAGDIVRENSVEIPVKKITDGSWSGTDYIDGPIVEGFISGAPFNMNSKDIQRYSGGQYTAHDIVVDVGSRKIFDAAGDDTGYSIQIGDILEFQNSEYEVTDDTEFHIYSDYVTLVCKRRRKK